MKLWKCYAILVQVTTITINKIPFNTQFQAKEITHLYLENNYHKQN